MRIPSRPKIDSINFWSGTAWRFRSRDCFHTFMIHAYCFLVAHIVIMIWDYISSKGGVWICFWTYQPVTSCPFTHWSLYPRHWWLLINCCNINICLGPISSKWYWASHLFIYFKALYQTLSSPSDISFFPSYVKVCQWRCIAVLSERDLSSEPVVFQCQEATL